MSAGAYHFAFNRVCVNGPEVPIKGFLVGGRRTGGRGHQTEVAREVNSLLPIRSEDDDDSFVAGWYLFAYLLSVKGGGGEEAPHPATL